MKYRGREPKIQKIWEKEACNLACSTQADEPHLLTTMQLSNKIIRKLQKRLRASESWQIANGIYHTSGVSVPAIASWGDMITVRVASQVRRYGILYLDYFETRYIFAIPARTMGSVFELPGFDFSSAELQLLRLMANELRSAEDSREVLITTKHPALKTAKAQRDEWGEVTVDQEKLLDLLYQEPLLLQVIVAAVDVQLRSFKHLERAPLGVYHFQVAKGGACADKWLSQVLQAVTFVNEKGRDGMGPIEIMMQTQADSKVYRYFPDRLVVVRTSTTSHLRPLLDEVELAEANRKAGWNKMEKSMGTPIVISQGLLHCRKAVDFLVPADITELSGEEQDLLRAAVARVLSKGMAKSALEQWEVSTSRMHAYRLDWFQIWRDILIRNIMQIWFGGSLLWQRAQLLLHKTQQEQEREEREREEKIAYAVELLGNPDRFKNQILTKRPESKDEAEMCLSSDAVAFRITFQRGADKGRTALAFTKDSLQRLLRGYGCSEMYYEAVLSRCEKLGLLDDKNRSITLGKETFNAVTIWVKSDEVLKF